MTRMHIRELPYTEDSETLMRALSGFEMPAYLDSAKHKGPNAGRDILAAAPVAYLSIDDGVIRCSQNAESFVDGSLNSSTIFNAIRELRDYFLPVSDQMDESQHGNDYFGAVIGYLGYPSLSGKSEFRLIDAFVGVYAWTLVVDHQRRTCSLRFHADCSVGFIEQVGGRLQTALANNNDVQAFHLETPIENKSSYESYEKAFNKIKSLIEQGDCYQINLTQCFKARCSGEPLAGYLRLREATTAPFSAFMHWGSGALLSLSPERFVSLRGKTVLTQPVKGTRPRGQSAQEDARLAQELAGSEKDTAENLMIVDLLRNDLGRVCETGSIKANQLFTIESFSNVHHMVSAISGTLRQDMDALDLLESCYPGGSITGAPKLSAMNIIRCVEQEPRRVYCGTVFCLGSAGNLDSSITIRSLLWQADELRCWAGGGIVADSDCEQEYQECFDKIGNIFKALER
ncbi:MAG: aminodeoxychorismate synthase component I [Pseudohongiellaceae bacterium]